MPCAGHYSLSMRGCIMEQNKGFISVQCHTTPSYAFSKEMSNVYKKEYSGVLVYLFSNT